MLEYPIHFKCKSKKRKSKNSQSISNTTESNTQSHIESCNDWLRIFDSQNLLDNYGERRVELVVGQRQFYTVDWSEESLKVEVTLQQFANWLKSDTIGTEGGGSLSDDYGALRKYPKLHYWAYLAYQRVFELFGTMNSKNVQDEYLQQIINCKPWEEVFHKFGDSGNKTGENLNLWWGSTGSYTPCHFDSYGVNVVFQVSGRKLWILYPPENYHNMYPTRLPYEDSSIFSQLDPVRPNFSKFPRFQSVASHAIILEEGDVLFVPKHWWHYVECLNDSLSINCWFDLDCDIFDRMKEISTCIQVNMLINGSTIRDKWIMDLLRLNKETTHAIRTIRIQSLSKKSREAYRQNLGLGANLCDFMCSCTSLLAKNESECLRIQNENRLTPFFLHKHHLPNLNLSLRDTRLFRARFVMPTIINSTPNNDISRQSLARIRKSSRASNQSSRNLQQPNQDSQTVDKNNAPSKQANPTIAALKEYVNTLCDFARLDSLVSPLLGNE